MKSPKRPTLDGEDSKAQSQLAALRAKLFKERKQLPIYSGQHFPLNCYNFELLLTYNFNITAKEKLIEEIANNQALIIVGETGSGKTTRTKHFCLTI